MSDEIQRCRIPDFARYRKRLLEALGRMVKGFHHLANFASLDEVMNWLFEMWPKESCCYAMLHLSDAGVITDWSIVEFTKK